MMTSQRRTLLAVLVGACLPIVATACSTSHSGGPALPADTASSRPGGPQLLPPVSSRPATAPRDRDPSTVDAGLAKLDPCGLVDLAVAGFPRPARQAPGAGACRYLTGNLHQVDVKLGAKFGDAERHVLAPRAVAGYRTYWGDVTLSRQHHSICQLDAPVSFTKSIHVRVEKQAGEPEGFDPCAVARAAADTLVPRVVATAGPALLFRADEPDQPAEGACVHWLSSGTTEGCRPYRPTRAPGDREELLRAGHSNSDVSCAAAIDVVRRVLGEAMVPVVYGQHCVFLEPTHAVSFSVVFSHVYVPNTYGVDPSGSGQTVEGRAVTTIAGHPAVTVPSNAKNHDGTPDLSRIELQVYVSPGHDADQPGLVSGHMTVTHPRGTADDTPADRTTFDLAIPLMTELMKTYFA